MFLTGLMLRQYNEVVGETSLLLKGVHNLRGSAARRVPGAG